MAEETMKRNKNWLAVHKAWAAIIVIGLIVAIAVSSGNNSAKKADNAVVTDTQSIQTTDKKAPVNQKPAERQVQGAAVTLGAGDFVGGQDVAVGLYDVTPGDGESGNFIVNDGEKVNEVLGESYGMGVSKVRTSIAKGDKIKISGLSQVTFTPVTSAFVTSHTNATLYAGTFKVGEDIGAGRYVVTPGDGESGNFIVNDGMKSNEVLGGSDGLGVPSVTVSLDKGDDVKLSGMSTVNFAAK